MSCCLCMITQIPLAHLQLLQLLIAIIHICCWELDCSSTYCQARIPATSVSIMVLDFALNSVIILHFMAINSKGDQKLYKLYRLQSVVKRGLLLCDWWVRWNAVGNRFCMLQNQNAVHGPTGLWGSEVVPHASLTIDSKCSAVMLLNTLRGMTGHHFLSLVKGVRSRMYIHVYMRAFLNLTNLLGPCKSFMTEFW